MMNTCPPKYVVDEASGIVLENPEYAIYWKGYEQGWRDRETQVINLWAKDSTIGEVRKENNIAQNI
jgi:hypothetical protein